MRDVANVEAHITGTVWKIEVAVGDTVEEGDTVAILESMKMEMPVEAEDAGTVKEILVARAQPPACPCRDLHSVTLTSGSTFELPPGTKAVDLTTRFGTTGVEEVKDAFGDVARTLRKGH